MTKIQLFSITVSADIHPKMSFSVCSVDLWVIRVRSDFSVIHEIIPKAKENVTQKKKQQQQIPLAGKMFEMHLSSSKFKL